MPRSSAIRAILRQSGQVACQRSGTKVAVRAEEQFAPNRPIFKALLLYISTRWDIDPGSVGEAMTAFCTASGSQSSHSVRFCAKARPLSMTAWPRDRAAKQAFPRLISFVDFPYQSDLLSQRRGTRTEFGLR